MIFGSIVATSSSVHQETIPNQDVNCKAGFSRNNEVTKVVAILSVHLISQCPDIVAAGGTDLGLVFEEVLMKPA